MMQQGSFQAIAAGLEQIMENARLDLRAAMDQFEELCLRITAERNVPIDIFTETRQAYKKIQDQLTKISGARQLLEGKYKHYYRRNYQLEKEIMQIAFLAKSLYLTFEETDAKRKRKGVQEYSEAHGQQIVFPWFQSKENQIVLLRNLHNLDELDYKTKFKLGFERRQEVIQNVLRSVFLFALLGEPKLIDILQSRMRFREYDITERYKEDEFRGALTHLKEVSPSEVQKVLRRIVGTSEFLKLKCLLLKIQSQDDLKKAIVRTAGDILRSMDEGEVRLLSI
ncbi:MAG: hypothetical protein ABSG44_00620 [Thermodesulfobacteriota bacterium]|jgi:hypothetical protein